MNPIRPILLAALVTASCSTNKLGKPINHFAVDEVFATVQSQLLAAEETLARRYGTHQPRVQIQTHGRRPRFGQRGVYRRQRLAYHPGVQAQLYVYPEKGDDGHF